MILSKWIRQTHRWLVYSPLPPLFLMMITGLYMFFLPYARRRGAADVGE